MLPSIFQILLQEKDETFLAWDRKFSNAVIFTDQAMKYDSARWYWEGTNERHIQNVKKIDGVQTFTGILQKQVASDVQNTLV